MFINLWDTIPTTTYQITTIVYYDLHATTIYHHYLLNYLLLTPPSTTNTYHYNTYHDHANYCHPTTHYHCLYISLPTITTTTNTYC